MRYNVTFQVQKEIESIDVDCEAEVDELTEELEELGWTVSLESTDQIDKNDEEELE
jgi:hypothetical protein